MMTYEAAIERLYRLPRFADAGAAAYKPGLERMERLLDALGRPHDALRAVHVAGTNGKGSTASFVAAIATAAGLKAGLHTSPHLWDFAERLRRDGQSAPPAWIVDAMTRYGGAFDAIEPSFFEVSVALAFRYFADESVDLAVVEVGLGGRLDATNVLAPEAAAASAITHIGLDHTDLLGATLSEIAREKAGIAKRDVPLLTSVDDPGALAAIEAAAAEAGAPVERVREVVALETEEDRRGGGTVRLHTPVRDYGPVRLGLFGAHQAWNAALAVRLAEVVLPGLETQAVKTGLADVVQLSGLRGRCEVWSEAPRIVADVAHNADGWRAALECARPEPGGRLWALVGVMADKDAAALAALLAETGTTAIPVGLPSPRALGCDALTAVLEAAGVAVAPAETVEEGVSLFRREAEPGDMLLVTGSHLTVEALGRVAPPT